MELSGFVRGPLIDESVINWLNQHAKGRRVALPVEVVMSPLGVESSFLRAGDRKINLRLDTGALSIDLPMHIEGVCKSMSCVVLLEGIWGHLAPRIRETIEPILSVTKFHGAIGVDDSYVRVLAAERVQD